MSLQPIPNQPINFLPSEIIGSCADGDYPTLIAEGDSALLQFEQSRCEDAEQWIVSPTFKGGDWNTNETEGYTVQTGPGGVCAVVDNGGSILQNTIWTPNSGNLYELRVVVSSVQGAGFRINVAGHVYLLTGVGEYVFTFTAQNTDQLQIELVDDTSAGCIASLFVWDANTSFELAIVAADGSEVAVVDPLNQPFLFTYSGRNVVVEWPLPEGVSGCFTFVLRDTCVYGETVEWCSQKFKVVECGDTVKLRVCNDADALGFVAGRFEVRVQGSLIRPTWEYEVAEERLSNGRINRHFIDRQSAYQFLIEIQDAKLHPFLAAMLMFDHFYINDGEWSIDAESYAPGYGDMLGSGGVALSVRKVQELSRKVLCDDLGPGCAPENDPICNTADVTINTVIVDAELFVRVDVLSSLGFEVSQINWSVDGVAQTPVSVGGVAGPYALGPVLSDQLIQVTLVNAQDPLCNDVREEFPARSLCLFAQETEGAQYFSLEYLGDNQLFFLVNTINPEEGQFLTIIAPDGQPYTIAQGEQLDFLGEGQEGSYCGYSSDEEGTPIAATWNELIIGGPDATNVDFSIVDLKLLGVDLVTTQEGEGLQLSFVEFDAAPDFRHMGSLRSINLSACSFPALPITAGMDLISYAISDCGISVAPSLTALPNMLGLDFTQNALPSSEANRVLQEGSATFTSNIGNISLQDQTPPAPPSGAGLTAKAELEGRSPGWAVTTD